jgi:hypothetical protein
MTVQYTPLTIVPNNHKLSVGRTEQRDLRLGPMPCRRPAADHLIQDLRLRMVCRGSQYLRSFDHINATSISVSRDWYEPIQDDNCPPHSSSLLDLNQGK